MNKRPSSGKGDRFRSNTDKEHNRGDKTFRPKSEDGRSHAGKYADKDSRGERPFKPRSEDSKGHMGKYADKDSRGERPFKPRSEDGRGHTGKYADKDSRGERPFKPRSEDGRGHTGKYADKDSRGERPFKPRSEDGKDHARKYADKDSRGDRPFKPRSEDGKGHTGKYADKDSRGERPFKPRSEDDKNYSDKNTGKRTFSKPKEDGAPSSRPFDRKPANGRPPKRTYEAQGSYGAAKPERDAKKGSFARSVDYDHRDKPKKTFDTPKPKKEKREDEEVLEEKPKTAFKTPHKYKKAIEQDTEKAAMATAGKTKKRRRHEEDEEEDDVVADKHMTLNKYIAHSGECGRREAADLVKQGKVKVNGELVTDPGYRVQETDMVTLVGKKLQPIKNFAYVLLNKPKGFITTTDDPRERKTIMDLVDNSGVERLYPVGRLDRNTTGLLLLTNDGDLAQKLSHPSHQIKKVYQVTLDKNLTKADFEKIAAGVQLEDGLAHVDEIAYLESKNEVGLEIHSGRNRIVRRIFESLGYVVEKLDRVMYAGLTKKNLPRGKWRFLNDQEIIHIKHFKS